MLSATNLNVVLNIKIKVAVILRPCLDIMRQTACLVVNPIIVDGYASLFNCTTAVRVSDPMTAAS